MADIFNLDDFKVGDEVFVVNYDGTVTKGIYRGAKANKEKRPDGRTMLLVEFAEDWHTCSETKTAPFRPFYKSFADAKTDAMNVTRKEFEKIIARMGNYIGPWEASLISGDMESCVEQLQGMSLLDAVRLVLWFRRNDSHVGNTEIDALAEHLGVFTDFDEDE